MSSKKNSKNTSKNRRQKSDLAGQQYMQFEPRNLLAITLVDGIVEIEGTLENDVVTIDPVDDDDRFFQVDLNGVENEQFRFADVLRVRFRALKGDDTFTNNTDVDSTAYGHDGDDVFIGGGGHNRFQGGDGRDELTGGPRNDVIRGRDGNDIINGKQRHDRLFGGNGSDQINGEQGRDVIRGDAGNDILSGGNLEDRIFGEGGDDEILGGTGDDHLVGGGGNDRIDGGDGVDKIIGNVGDDSLSGGDGNDELRGGEGEDVLSGENGADLINGHEGDDLIVGGDGRDTIDGGDANDQIFGGEGPDVIDGGSGDDEIHGNEDVDVINGGDGIDQLFGGVDNNIINGDAGRDIIFSGGLADSIVDGDLDLIFEFRSELASNPDTRWVAEQIQTVAGAVTRMMDRADNIAIIGDPEGSNRIQFVKGTDLEPETRREEGLLTFQIPEWDSSIAAEKRETTSEIIQLYARLWSDTETINGVFTGSGSFVELFQAVSDWTEGTDVPEGYVASTDGEWFYLEDAEFFTDEGRTNPVSDWANMWDFTFTDIKNPIDVARLADKTAVIDAFFDSLA